MVDQRGTAFNRAAGGASVFQELHSKNCLISQRFAFKFLALQTFRKNGFMIEAPLSKVQELGQHSNKQCHSGGCQGLLRVSRHLGQNTGASVGFGVLFL